MIGSDKKNIENNQYDVCMITMSELKHDARTLNIARTLVKNGFNVCILGLGSNEDSIKFKTENIDFLFIENQKFDRAYQKLLYFKKSCKEYYKKIISKSYWASDFFSLPFVSHFSRLYNSKFYYDAREIYSAIGSLHNRKATQMLQTLLEKHWVKHVDKIIVTGELDKEYLMKHFENKIPYFVIKNFPAYKEHIESDLLRKKFNISPDKKILIYQGMLSSGRGILPTIKALPFLEEFVLCLLGDGQLKEEAMSLAKELGVENRVFFTGNIDYDELHKLTCSADIGLSIIEPISFSYKLALPNKLFEYCMAQIPSISSDLPAMKEVIEQFGIGLTINHLAKPEEIAQSIRTASIKENYQNYKNACKTASKQLSFDSQENILISIFN